MLLQQKNEQIQKIVAWSCWYKFAEFWQLNLKVLDTAKSFDFASQY